MAELDDYSGPFKPDLTYEDLSKDFLIKLMRSYQWTWMQTDAAWFDQIKLRFGAQAAWDLDLQGWLRPARRANPRYAKIANIPLKNVVDCLKVLQLPMDNTMGGIYPVEYDVKNENHAIVTVNRCPNLEWCEKQEPERIVPMCQIGEPIIIDNYKVNPNVQLRALKLPPRKSPEDIACQWEYKLEVPQGVRVRSKDEVVDGTTDIPELNDLSGPFYLNLTYVNLSKAFLIKLVRAWQHALLMMNEGFYDGVKQRFGSEIAVECELEAWVRVAERVSRRYVKLANIQLRTVLDSLKALQLPLDNTMGLFPAEYSIKSPNHVILTVTQFRTQALFEEPIRPRGHVLVKPLMEKCLVNPNIRVTPLKLPPCRSPETILCQWELRL